MRVYLRTLSIILSIALLFLAAFVSRLILGEGYNPFFPEIDTRYTAGYTAQKFESINIGMDTTVVYSIIGKPFNGKLWYDPYVNGYVWYYSDDGGCKCFDFAWIQKYIILDSNWKVKFKGTTIAYD